MANHGWVKCDTMRWIKCSDRLPEKDGEYLVTWKLPSGDEWSVSVESFSTNLNHVDSYDFPEEFYEGRSGFYWYEDNEVFCGYNELSRVTHWMPLPEPPEN